MKKIYLKPDIKIVDIKPTQLLNSSGSGDPQTIHVYRYPEQDPPTIDNEEDVW